MKFAPLWQAFCHGCLSANFLPHWKSARELHARALFKKIQPYPGQDLNTGPCCLEHRDLTTRLQRLAFFCSFGKSPVKWLELPYPPVDVPRPALHEGGPRRAHRRREHREASSCWKQKGFFSSTRFRSRFLRLLRSDLTRSWLILLVWRKMS